jgi:hypothetical protein
VPVGAVAARQSAVARALERVEGGLGTRRGMLVVFLAAIAVFAIESIALPVIPGRDFGTYLRFYAQMWDWHSVWPMTMLFRTPLAPLVVGLPLDSAGGWGVQLVMTLLFAASVTAWTSTALVFGRRVALLTMVALLLYPGYSILFHGLASDPVAAATFAAWALALARAARGPSVRRFAGVGLAVAATALSRPGYQVLVASALFPLVVAIPWRRRLVYGVSCLAAALLVLGAWTVANGIRYDDYTVARGGAAYLPFFRAFTKDHIVEPGNGPESRRLATIVQKDLLTQEPYRSYGVTLDAFFARGSDREFEDVLGLSDRVWGWNSDYAHLRTIGIEAVRAHPGTYARGVAATLLDELWHPLYVALPSSRVSSDGSASPSSAAGSTSATVVVNGKRLPRPSGGDMIPAAHQGFYSTTPDGHIREVWTSPTAHTVVFSTKAGQRRFEAVNAEVDRLTARVPPYAGSTWLTRQFSRSSKLFPPPLLWLVVGCAGVVLRRPRHAALALAFALGALAVIFFQALGVYSIIEFAVPVAPAFVVLGAAGLLGERRAVRLPGR